MILQAGVLTFGAAYLVASTLAPLDCFVFQVLGVIVALMLAVILVPIWGLLVFLGQALVQAAPWARVVAHVISGAEFLLGLLLLPQTHVGGFAAIGQSILGVIIALLPSAPADSSTPQLPSRRTSVWLALILDPWARLVAIVAVILALVVGFAFQPPPKLASDGLPAHPGYSFIASRPESTLTAPGATAYYSQIDSAQCGGQADSYGDFRTSRSAATTFAWYNNWLLAHGWKRQPANAMQQEVGARGYPSATYLRGPRESFEIDFASPEAPPYHAGPEGVTPPTGAASVFETAYIIRSAP
jgi:hypothetical protein